MDKETKIEALEEKFTKKEIVKTGWATLVLKNDWVQLESFRTKWEFTEDSGKISYIMKWYVWWMTQEIFDQFKDYVVKWSKNGWTNERPEEIQKLYDFFDQEFIVILTDTTNE